MNKYDVLNNKIFINGEYSIVPYREGDLFLIKQWRNEQLDILRQKVLLTNEDQENYYKKVIEPSFSEMSPKIILFSFLKNNKCIGYGGLTNIDWESKRVELSFLLETKRVKNDKEYEKDFSEYLGLIKEVVFSDLQFHRIFTETFDIRPLHIKILEKNGFKFEGRMKDHVKINGLYIDSIIHGLLNPKDME